MGAKSNADALQDQVLPMFGNDMAACKSLAEQILDGLGRALDPFAGAENEDATRGIQIDDFVATVRTIRRFKKLAAKDKLLSFQAHDPQHGIVRVSRLHAGFQYLYHHASTFRMAVRCQRISIENSFLGKREFHGHSNADL
jgi:hypothetical protein